MAASRKLIIKCRWKNSNQTLYDLSPNENVGHLKASICSVLNLDSNRLRVLHGYPPREVNLFDDQMMISELPIKSGDILIVNDDGPTMTASSKIPVAAISPVQRQPEQRETSVSTEPMVLAVLPEGILLQCLMPGNNSCLFASVYFAVAKKIESDYLFLRNIIATAVKADPVTYNEGFLGKTNQEYCRWILQGDHWGGGIELSILCKHYGFEIVTIDLQSGHLHHFGEDSNFDNRIFLIYNGVHYDVVALKLTDEDSELLTIFSAKNEIILQKANELALEAKLKKEDQNYIDKQGTRFTCSICKEVVTSQAKITQHAGVTGHVNFHEG